MQLNATENCKLQMQLKTVSYMSQPHWGLLIIILKNKKTFKHGNCILVNTSGVVYEMGTHITHFCFKTSCSLRKCLDMGSSISNSIFAHSLNII